MSRKVQVPMLMYHKIANGATGAMRKYTVTPGIFERQMSFLRRKGYEAISMDLLVKILVGEADALEKPIVITFDDGYRNYLTEALPILCKFGLKATIFLVAKKIGGVNDWDTKDSELLSWEEIRRMQRQGISFQAHSCTHPSLL